MVEAVISVVVEKVTGCLLDPLCRQFGYLFNYRRNVSDLNQQIHSLESTREGVQRAVDEANRRGDEIHSHVQEWLSYAQGIVQNRDAFSEAEKIASKSCFYFKSRFRLSKQAKREAEEIAAKIGEAREFISGPGENRVSYRPPPTSVVPFINSSSFKDYEAFESRESTSNQIMGALRHEDIKRVGVWGMGGVGKTTLVKQVAKQAEEEKLFHKVIVVLNVTQKPDIFGIQERIAGQLGSRFESEDGVGRATQLGLMLKKVETVLVILDDIWEKVELGEIGIPRDDHDHMGCKLLMTSRKLPVLKDMGTQKQFCLKHLNESEGWNLFTKMASCGDSLQEKEKVPLPPMAVHVAKECDGLPVAIVTVAKALKGEEDPAVWRNALEELRTYAPANIEGVNVKVYSCLQLSYNHLKSEEAKSLFLLCSLVGDGDISMDRLLQYAMGLNLFKGLYSCEKAADRLITLVKSLKVSSLLLDNHDQDRNDQRSISLLFDEAFVRMHDVVRDVARSIASKDPHRFVAKEGFELREWQRRTDEFRNCTRISLMCRGDMFELAQGRLVCPQLEFFLLDSRNGLKIRDDFFQDTKQLRVLDLCETSLALSPSSLCSSLPNLQTLCLRKCRMKSIAVIGELKRLQILSLVGSDIKRLPEEMKQLSDLRVLDLCNCYNLEVIPRNVISSLSQLEYLSMRGCRRMQWDPEGPVKGINACFSELKHLSKLRALEVQVSNVSWLPKDDDAVVVFNHLNFMTKYSIEIGPTSLWTPIPVDACKASRKLVLNEVKSPETVKCFSKLLKRSQFVHLEKLSMNNIYLDDDLDNINDKNVGFEELKSLSMTECHGIHSIPGNALVKLEVLKLYFLDNLEVVCQEPINPTESFANLRGVRLGNCKRLKYVFTLPPATLLNQTAELDFPRLQFLSLWGLNDIINFFYFTGCTHEESLVLFNHKATFPALESLQLYFLDKVRALWHNQLPAAHSFSKLKTLELGNCKNLLNIFPLSLAKALVQLEHLSIRNCKVLEAIVVVNEDEDLICSNLSLFPKLTSLRLGRLPQLMTFCSGNSKLIVRWPLLKTLKLQYCRKVEILFQGIGQLEEGTGDHEHQHPLFFLDKVSFSSLESLDIEVLVSLKAVWRHNQLLLVDSFSKLKELKINSCYKLLNPFPSNILLKGLQILQIWNCDGLEKIFDLKRINGKETVVEDIAEYSQSAGNSFFNKDDLFQNLQSLEAFNCPRLEYVFPVCVAKTLMQLQYLQINCCQEVKTIIFNEDEALMPSFSFPKLTSLTLIDLPGLKKFCSGRFTSTCSLLKELQVCDCDKMEIVSQEICLKDHDTDDKIQLSLFLVEKVAFPSIENLGLRFLPNVRELWHSQLPENSNSFSKLKTLQLNFCNKVLNIFPLRVAKALVQLEDFCIEECESVEAIVVANAKDDEQPYCNLFPKLTSLSLDTLPQLKTFCSGRLTLRWPLLKTLKMSNCDKVEILFQGQLEGDELDDDHRIQQPFFLVDKVSFPSLEKLNIQRLDSVKALWHNQVVMDSFPKLEELRIDLCNGLLNPFESNIIHKGLPLTVEDCDSVNENVIQFERLLPSAQVQLDVETVVPQHLDVLFWNLQTLVVTGCGSLMNLLTSSTAKRVANQLKGIDIRECQMMNDVVGNNQKGAPLTDDDEIEFTRLEHIALFGLPNLKSFCSERYMFRFPSLQAIIVENCPKVERFCNGVLDASRIHCWGIKL